jgi:bacterioferritin
MRHSLPFAEDPTGSATESSRADRSAESPLQVRVREDLIALLMESLATELVRLTRFEHDPDIARGMFASRRANRRFVLTTQELTHAARMVERVVQLGGVPDISPERLNQRMRDGEAGAAYLRGFVNAQLLTVRVNIEVFGKILVLISDGASSLAPVLEGLIQDARDHVKALELCLAGRGHAASFVRQLDAGDVGPSDARADSPANGPRYDRADARRVVRHIPSRRDRRP